jgi:small GTP-binding protein
VPAEDSYSVNRTIDGQNYFLMLTDTAGQEEYRGLWAASNLRSDAFLLVYDITNANSLDALDYFIDMIEMETEQRLDEGRVPPVKIVAGNKCDLQGARQIRSPQGLEWARKRNCGFMETSAREMVNIEETFARTYHPHSGHLRGRGLYISLLCDADHLPMRLLLTIHLQSSYAESLRPDDSRPKAAPQPRPVHNHYLQSRRNDNRITRFRATVSDPAGLKKASGRS